MSNKDPDQRLTPEERARLVERHHEWALLQRWIKENNLQRTLEVARKIKARGL
jgi:hypothetical protein